MVAPAVVIDDFRIPRIGATTDMFGIASPASGIPVVMIPVLVTETPSLSIDMVAYNNLFCEAEVVLGSGTTAVEVFVQSSSNNINWSDNTTQNFIDDPEGIEQNNLPIRFKTSDRFSFPLSWNGGRFVRFTQRSNAGILSTLALSVSPYHTTY